MPDKWGRKKGAEIGGDEGDMRGGTGVEKKKVERGGWRWREDYEFG